MDLKQELLRQRHRAYVAVRGGFTFPLAGAIWWAVAAALGARLSLEHWLAATFIGSGLIFPLALLLSAIFRLEVMKGAATAADTVIGPAFVGMLLFWPAAVAAYYTAPELAPLILAIGMAGHWPVIGWSYGRSALFGAHAVVRALAVFAAWVAFPEERTTLIPGVVSVIYAATVVAILFDVAAVKRRLSA